MRYQGLLYRALNPLYAKEPLSGKGAKRFGGRFNPKGAEALHTCLSIETAIRESNQVGTLQPTTLVAYEADLKPIFDARDADALHKRPVSLEELGTDTWRDEMREHGESASQKFARQLINDGFVGLIVPSFIKGAREHDINLVIWKWKEEEDAKLSVIDDEHRLA